MIYDYSGTIYEGLKILLCDYPWCNRVATYWERPYTITFPICDVHKGPDATPMKVKQCEAVWPSAVSGGMTDDRCPNLAAVEVDGMALCHGCAFSE